MVVRPDLVEGLKSLFVDRSYVPKFNPRIIEEVNLQEIQRCFEPCSRKLFDNWVLSNYIIYESNSYF